jgi:hypothetical protein
MDEEIVDKAGGGGNSETDDTRRTTFDYIPKGNRSVEKG